MGRQLVFLKDEMVLDFHLMKQFDIIFWVEKMSFVVAVFVCLFVLCGSDEIFGGKKLETM